MRILLFLHLKKLESPSSKNDLCWDWLKLTHWFCRRFFNFVNVFSLFHYYLPFEKGWALHLNKLESPLHKEALCQVWLKLVQWFLRIFLNFVDVFSLFVIISPWKRAGPFICIKLTHLHPKMHCAKFGWHWFSGSWGENFKISPMYFRYFVNISLWKRMGPVILINLNSLHPWLLCAKVSRNWSMVLNK